MAPLPCYDFFQTDCKTGTYPGLGKCSIGCLIHEVGKLGVFAFDRIADVKVEEEKFTIDENFDAANYFCDSYGIVVDNSLEVQHIVLRAYGAERYYLRDLPIHHSQRVINTTDEYTDFEMKLRPTADFKAHLLSRGQWVEILEPQSLADEIIEWHQKAIDRYKKEIDFFM